MKYIFSGKVSQTEISHLIEIGWDLEARRDLEGVLENFAPIWANIDEEPDFSKYEILEQAALYRLSGYFLSYFGKARNKKNFQERSKDLLSKAISLFMEAGEFHLVAEAQNCLSTCYFHDGSLVESEIILEQTAEDFLSDSLHLIYLKNRGNLLSTKIQQKKYSEALRIIEEIQVPMEFCEDKRARITYHDKAGLIYRHLKQYENAVWHYEESIRNASELKEFLFISISRNNLAFLFYKTKDFLAAHRNIEEALKIAQKHNFIGWLPIYLDTKALIVAAEGHIELALDTIEKALSILVESDDYYSITDSMWNKCKFLFQLDRREEAILVFNELISLAGQKMGEFAVKNFVKEFSKLIHVKQEGSLDNEISRFKRVEIINSIEDNNYDLQLAADSLEIDFSALAEMLDYEFPEIYGELDLLPISSAPDNLTEKVEKSHNVPRKISPLHLHNVSLSETNRLTPSFSTFFVSSELTLEVLGIEKDLVIAFAPLINFKTDEFLLIYCQESDSYSFGKCLHDKDLDIYYLNTGKEPEPLSFNDVKIIGKAIEYLPFSEIDNESLFFSPLNFQPFSV